MEGYREGGRLLQLLDWCECFYYHRFIGGVQFAHNFHNVLRFLTVLYEVEGILVVDSGFDKGTNDTYNYICEPHELLEMVGTITVNPYDESNATDSNSTGSVGSEQDDMSTSSSLSGFLFIPALVLIILVSRRLR